MWAKVYYTLSNGACEKSTFLPYILCHTLYFTCHNAKYLSWITLVMPREKRELCSE